MKPALILPALLAACVQSAPPDPDRITKVQFEDDGNPWLATVQGNPGTIADVEVTGGGGPTAPVKDFAMQGCTEAGGTFDPSAKLTYEDPGLYTFIKACQL